MEPKLIWFFGSFLTMAVTLLMAALLDVFRAQPRDVGPRPSGALVHIAVPGILLTMLPALGYDIGPIGMLFGLLGLAITVAIVAKRRTNEPTMVGPVPIWLSFFVLVLLSAVSLRLVGFVTTTLADLTISSSHAIVAATAVLIIGIALGGVRLSRFAVVLQSVVFGALIVSVFAAFIEFMGGSTRMLVDTWKTLKAQSADALQQAGLSGWAGGAGVVSEASHVGSWPPVLIMTAAISAAGLATIPVLRTQSARARVSNTRIILLGMNWAFLLALFAVSIPLMGLGLGTSTLLSDAAPDLIETLLFGFLAEQGASELTETRGGALSLLPFIWNAWTDTAPWAVGILGSSFAIIVICGRIRSWLAIANGFGARPVISRTLCILAIVVSAALADQLLLSSLPALLFLTFGLAIQSLPSYLNPRPARVDAWAAALGALVVLMTDPTPWQLLGLKTPSVVWPLSIHSGLWGLMVNMAIRWCTKAITNRTQTA